MILNRDDQAGFRLDTTYDHKHGKVVTLENKPSLTTRTDFVNAYPSILQTTSYLFMETKNTAQTCAGVIKAHHLYPKNAAQHAADLQTLQKDPEFSPHMADKEIDCIRVDGAADESPSHHEVQFFWAERHMIERKVTTLVTTRHSGGSYLNRVELVNGGLAQAHANIYIPSTINGSNYGVNGLDDAKLRSNLNVATDIYINRVNGSMCAGSPIELRRGGVADLNKREKLLVYLKGTVKARKQLKEDEEELFSYFEKVWKIRKNHMIEWNKYIYHLVICGEVSCPHPLCQRGINADGKTWYDGGPSLRWLPLPVPDPNNPKHFMKADEVIANQMLEAMIAPPSAILQDAMKDQDFDLDALSVATLLPTEEVGFHMDFMKEKRDRIRQAGKKRRKKDLPVCCIVCNEEAEIECTADCTDNYCLRCLGLTVSPPLQWKCPMCRDDTIGFCLCRQEEYGEMLGCDNDDCPIEWFHLECLGMSQAPNQEKWYCPKCSATD